ncbi:MAG: hypothetical protein KGL39_46520 [Patescibacteria group bacterium]|nr:hypothetical protein [Patescibacteria group bacterium]
MRLPVGENITPQMVVDKQLRLDAAWVWGVTGSFRTDKADELLSAIHDRLEGISAAFRDEIREVWGDE